MVLNLHETVRRDDDCPPCRIIRIELDWPYSGTLEYQRPVAAGLWHWFLHNLTAGLTTWHCMNSWKFANGRLWSANDQSMRSNPSLMLLSPRGWTLIQEPRKS